MLVVFLYKASVLKHYCIPHPQHTHTHTHNTTCSFTMYFMHNFLVLFFVFIFSDFFLREEISESGLALFFISYQWYKFISDWSFKMLAWGTLPLEIHWRYGCWWIYSSCTLCEASKGWCTMYLCFGFMCLIPLLINSFVYLQQ